VALTPFKDAAVANADVLLPIAPFTETAGAYVNAEGRLQAFQGVVKGLGDSRPAWKVLRVLGNLLGLEGFSQESVEEVRSQALGDANAIAGRLSNRSAASFQVAAPVGGLQRVADVPLYSTDSLVRRAQALQHTADAKEPVVGLPSSLWAQLGLQAGAKVMVSQEGHAAAVLPAREDANLASNVVRVAAGHASTVTLGAMFGTISVEKA
jgi:NADH-quinone oxidoreductase subunit G